MQAAKPSIEKGEGMEGSSQEWLVTDQRGAFAMGTREGVRTRKYHGFFLGIPGRAETAGLLDIDLEFNSLRLWPHRYASPEGSLIYPNLEESGLSYEYEITPTGPRWSWTLPEGTLNFHISAHQPGGISLHWKWNSRKRRSCHLKIRPFWAMRDLHSLGGQIWSWNEEKDPSSSKWTVEGIDGRVAFCLLEGTWNWTEDPQWYQNFYYSEEVLRGDEGKEDLYSAGILETDLESNQSCGWIIAFDAKDLEGNLSNPQKEKIIDFVLTRPAGIVAGYPWFGEWGRDTFVSLPGIISTYLRSESDPDQLWIWVSELMNRWGYWIHQKGMLPNILEKNGEYQWESADATLWWCHSLSSLWMFSLCYPKTFPALQIEFYSTLEKAIHSIREGRHRFLKELPNGLLEVTAPHVTWMDARVNGQAVTPRMGCLPEINALWFEACCLYWLWSDDPTKLNQEALQSLGEKVLQCSEPDRPNTIFLHSLPLAPSFVLKNQKSLETGLLDLAEKFWTPVGLRSLRSNHPHYKPHCSGTQEERDRSYHQGAVWGWLGGQFEIAKDRYHLTQKSHTSEGEKMFTKKILEDMPIEGHIPEIFDADPPFTPRGAPAQAWSLACFEEAKARRKLKADSKISKVLTRRWLGRNERKIKTKSFGSESELAT